MHQRQSDSGLSRAERGDRSVRVPIFLITVQLQSTNQVDENSVAFRFDYKVNASNSAYFRFFRDQGTNNQPEGVTGRRIAIRSVPQNAVLACNRSQADATERIQDWVQFGALADQWDCSDLNGIDFSSVSLNIAGSVAGFALPGQGANAGVASPGGLVRANSATNGRGQPYNPTSSFH